MAQQKRLLMLGAIRQEVLSGIREPQRFEWLRQKLRAFPDFPVSLEDYETAAEFYNSCRAKGVQGSIIHLSTSPPKTLFLSTPSHPHLPINRF